MDITEFRRRYPYYDKASDDELSRALHKKFYSHVDYNTFAERFGVPAEPTVTVAERPQVDLLAGRPPATGTGPSVSPGEPAPRLRPAPPELGAPPSLAAEQTQPPLETYPTSPGTAPGEPAPPLRPYPGRVLTREQKAREFLDRLRGIETPAEIYPERPPGPVKRGLEAIFGERGAVTPESAGEAVIAAQAAREGKRPAQYAKEVGARTGLLERALEDLGAGAIGVGAGMLGYAARVTDAQGLAVAGAEVQAQAADLMPPNPNLLDEILSGFGSTVAFFVPGMGIVRGATAIGQVAPRMAYWLGAGAAAGMEAAAEAGFVYQERIEQGATPEEAAESADAAFWANTFLVTATNRLGLFGDRGSRLMRRTLSGVIEGPGQEGPQQIISNLATGRPWFEDVPTSAFIGTVVGTTLGGARTPAELAGERYARGIERTEFEVPAEEMAVELLRPPRGPDIVGAEDATDIMEAPTVDDAIEEARRATEVATDVAEDIAAAVEPRLPTAPTPDIPRTLTPSPDIDAAAREIADLTAAGRMEEAVAAFERAAAPLDEAGVEDLGKRVDALRQERTGEVIERDAMILETQRIPEDDTGPFPEPKSAGQVRDQLAWVGQRLQSAERVAGERWPQAEDATQEERQAASNRAKLLRQESESLRELLRFYEKPPERVPRETGVAVTPEKKPEIAIPPATPAPLRQESGAQAVPPGRETPVEVPKRAKELAPEQRQNFERQQEIMRALPQNIGRLWQQGKKLSATKQALYDELQQLEKELPNTSPAYRQLMQEARTEREAKIAKQGGANREKTLAKLKDAGFSEGDKVSMFMPPMIPGAPALDYSGVVKISKHGTAYVSAKERGVGKAVRLDLFRNPWKKETVAKAEPKEKTRLETLQEHKARKVPMTAAQERELEVLERREAADVGKWAVGDGVGYRIDRQINRGFQITEIDKEAKRVKLRQVADTGLTVTGGADRLADTWVHVGDLVRERKYDAPTPPAKPSKKPRSLKWIQMPAEEVQVEETGETVTIRENAEAALSRINEKLAQLKALRDCLEA